MKGNLHFIVFGACAVIGIVLAFVGASKKSSSTDLITQQAQKLQAPDSYPTKGDIAKAQKLRKAYDASITDSESRLRSEGLSLTAAITDTPDAGTFRSSAGIELAALEARADELRLKDPRSVQFHKWVKGDKIDGNADEPFKKLRDELGTLTEASLVKPFQIRLVIINEFLTIAESLLKQPQFADGNGLDLASWSFEELSADKSGNEEMPFVRYPFNVTFNADAALATAIMDEFLNPSENTAQSGPKNKRQNFPVELVNFAMKQGKRPAAIYVDVPRAEAMKMGLPEEMIEGEGGWSAELKNLARKMANLETVLKDIAREKVQDGSVEEKQRVEDAEYTKNVRFNLPLKCDLGLAALKLNTKWKAINKQEVTDQ